MEEEVYTGIIKGQEKDQDILNEYMLSTISSIKNQDLIKNDSLKIIPDFLITSNEGKKCKCEEKKKKCGCHKEKCKSCK